MLISLSVKRLRASAWLATVWIKFMERGDTMAYYNEDDLGRFSEIGKHCPDLFEKFMAWYQACQQDGALSRREKALIGLAVAHALQCPYCIDAYAQSCLESGSNLEQMTEAIHMASAIRGGAALIHGLQTHNSVHKVSM
jgi:alkylhydroperoxidase/carboxymuconolactone decarboxylase family protein